ARRSDDRHGLTAGDLDTHSVERSLGVVGLDQSAPDEHGRNTAPGGRTEGLSLWLRTHAQQHPRTPVIPPRTDGRNPVGSAQPFGPGGDGRLANPRRTATALPSRRVPTLGPRSRRAGVATVRSSRDRAVRGSAVWP